MPLVRTQRVRSAAPAAPGVPKRKIVIPAAPSPPPSKGRGSDPPSHECLAGGAVLAPMVVTSIVGAVIKWRASPGDSPATAAAADERSLVGLPFTSVGGDTANSYFAAGIADELTSALMQIPGLRLAGRASAARVKEQGGGAREIGEALNVAAVLDGSVRRAGARIRVSAELTSAGDERVIWSRTYERSLADVFAVQDEITREIVAALQLRLVAADGSAPNLRL